MVRFTVVFPETLEQLPPNWLCTVRAAEHRPLGTVNGVLMKARFAVPDPFTALWAADNGRGPNAWATSAKQTKQSAAAIAFRIVIEVPLFTLSLRPDW